MMANFSAETTEAKNKRLLKEKKMCSENFIPSKNILQD